MTKKTPYRSYRLLLLPLAAASAIAWAADDNGDGPTPADIQKSQGTLLHPKVEKPIPDTYKPLNGTDMEDRDVGTGPIKQSLELQKEKQDREKTDKLKQEDQDKNKSAEPVQKHIRIDDAVPDAAPATPAAPKVDKGKDSIDIHD